MKTKEFLENYLEELKKALYKANEELKKLPDGKLYHELRCERHIYFCAEYDRVTSRIRRRMINCEPQLICQLARKEYLKKEIEILEKDIALFEEFLKKYNTKYIEPSVYNIFQMLPARLSALPADIFLNGGKSEIPFTYASDIRRAYFSTQTQNVETPPLSDFSHYPREVAEWALKPYLQSDYMPEGKTHRTSRGMRVRSKSESIIVEKLYEYKVPFRYEEVLERGSFKMIPDFTLMDLYGNVYYWEHCGLPGNPDYMKRHKRKLEQYEQLGIVAWKNLIVTYDNESGNINIPTIESEIRNKLL